MNIKEVITNIEKLEKSRTDLMSFIGAEVAKHPSLKKAFEDLELVNGSLLKCREEKDKLEKAAEEDAEALAKAHEESAAEEAEDAAKAEIEKAISEEKEISDQFVEDLAKAYSLTTDKVEDIIAGVLEAQADQD